jgi:hypothetical protein
MPSDPDNWLPYILVDDVAVSTKKAKSLGATIAENVTGHEVVQCDFRPDRCSFRFLVAKSRVNETHVISLSNTVHFYARHEKKEKLLEFFTGVWFGSQHTHSSIPGL